MATNRWLAVSSTAIIIFGIAGALSILDGCSAQPNDVSGTSENERYKSPPTQTNRMSNDTSDLLNFYKFKFHWSHRTDGELQVRATQVAEVLDHTLGAVSIDWKQTRVTDKSAQRLVVWLGDDRNSGASLSYDFDHDDLRISRINRDSLSAFDIGESAAKARFFEVVQKLKSNGIIDSRYYDVNRAVLTPTIEAGGAGSEVLEHGIVEYGFSVLRNVRGIPVENAGVIVRIGRSGNVASVRIGGVAVESQWTADGEMPLEQGTPIRAVLTEAEAAARFRTEHPAALVQRAGIAYAVGDVTDEAVVAPRYVVHFSDRSTVDGRTVTTRQRVIAYSLIDMSAPPEDLGPKPKPSAPGDERK